MNSTVAQTVQAATQPKKRNLAQGTYSTNGEKIDWTYYDTQFPLTSSVSPMHFFQAGQGQPMNDGTTIKTLQHTNMTIGQQLPRGQRLTIRNLKVMYTAVTQYADAAILGWYNFLANTTLEFLITGKDAISSMTLQEILGASTLVLPAVAAGSGYATVNRIVLPRFHGIFPLNTPIVLAEQTNFEVRVIPQVAVAAAQNKDFLKIGLNGILERLS